MNRAFRYFIFWGIGLVIFLALGLGFSFFVLRFVFSRSIFLGLLVLFLIFPVISRLFGLLFLAGVPAFLARFFKADGPSPKDADDKSAIDVSYRIVD